MADGQDAAKSASRDDMPVISDEKATNGNAVGTEKFPLINEHYLKRELLQLELDHEVLEMQDFKKIGSLGLPFALRDGQEETLPLLQLVFRNCIETFPFIANVDKQHFWRDRIQPFLEGFGEMEISSSADRVEATKRSLMAAKFKRLIFLYAASGIRTVRDEKDAKIERISEAGVQNLDSVGIRETLHQGVKPVNGYEITVCGVRKTQIRRKLFFNSDVTYEYIIQSRIATEGAPVVYSARRYHDFVDLDRKLRREFPGKQLPRLPGQHRAATVTENLNAFGSSIVDSAASISTAGGDSTNDDGEDDFLDEASEKSESSNNSAGSKTKLFREKQRITLRAYIADLVKIPQVTRNKVFLEFLFLNRLPKLTTPEIKDISLRKQMDLVRLQQQIRFFQIASERSMKLETHIANFKQELLRRNGLLELFHEIRVKRTISELSPPFQKFIDWMTIEFAATIYQMLVAEDSSPEFYGQVRKLHRLLPYSVLKGILRWTNPAAMIKAIIDLFLAQPFGKRSLLQTILWVTLGDDIRHQERLLTAIKEKFPGQAAIFDLIDKYVDSPFQVREQTREAAEHEGADVVIGIFRHSDTFGVKPPPSVVKLVGDWHSAWEVAVVKGDDAVKDSRSVDNYSQLKEYLKLRLRKRDKDKLQEFWSDSGTISLIKELLTVFYSPFIQLLKTSKIHESLGDLQSFLDDMIRVVDRAEQLAASADPNELAESFIKLCQRHRESAYRFVHRVYENDRAGLFDSFITWIGGIIEFLREGTPRRLDMVKLVDTARESGAADYDKVQEEMSQVVQWLVDRRVWRDRNVASQSAAAANSRVDGAGLDWQEALPSGALQGSDFGLDQDDLDELHQADEDDEADLRQHDDDDAGLSALERERRQRNWLEKKFQAQASAPKKPSITETPKLLPLFHQQLLEVLHATS